MLQGLPSAKVHPHVVSTNFTHFSSSAACSDSHRFNLAISFALDAAAFALAAAVLAVTDGPLLDGATHTVDDVTADSVVVVSTQLMWEVSGLQCGQILRISQRILHSLYVNQCYKITLN